MIEELNQLAVCRICYSGENSGLKSGEPLISPCNCKGTMGLYHRTCIKKWLVASNTWMCEICKFRFDIRKSKRSFLSYLKDKNAICERKTLLTDVLCFIVLTPLVFFSVVFCISWAIEFQYNYHENDMLNSKTALALSFVFLSFILLLVYWSWFIVTLIFHRKSFKYWQNLNPDFEVMDQLSFEDSILINGSQPRSLQFFNKRYYKKRVFSL